MTKFDGTTRSPGRPKGSKNRTSKEAAQAVLQSLENRGGIKYLDKLDSKLYVSLLRQIMPKDLTIDANIHVGWEQMVKAVEDAPE